MFKRLLNLWDRLRSSYWFVPTLLAVGAIVLAFSMVALDNRLTESVVEEMGWFYTGGAEGARALLSAIATSVITVAGTVFSITIAALTLASSQFGPRLLRNFMRDVGNQIVLGTFVATYIYCLLVLRTIRGSNGGSFVPNLSVTVGVVLAAASLGVLIYFIHHIARSMQASQVIAAVAGDLREGIDNLFPQHIGQAAAGNPPGGEGDEGHLKNCDADGAGPGHPSPSDLEAGEATTVQAESDGYLQFIYDDALMELAREHDLVVRLLRRPGDYVMRGTPLARVWPAERAGGDEVARRLRDAMALGSERTPAQDVRFCVDQLVEVAVRALSPGINDPFTAMTCIDRLGSALNRLAGRRMPAPCRLDDQGRVRVVAEAVSFESVVEAAVCPIRDFAGELAAPQVMQRLRSMLIAVASQTADAGRRAVLLRHAEGVVPRGLGPGHDAAAC